MNHSQKRKFASYEEAKSYLEERGKLEFFGRIGTSAEIYVYNIRLQDGRMFKLFLYEDGLLEILE